MDSTRNPDRTGEILAHLEWIRETLGDLKERAQEDRESLWAHEDQDRREFAWLRARIYRLQGGIAFFVFLVGAGTAVAKLVLD